MYASIASLLQVNSTQLTLEVAAVDRFIIQSSGYLVILKKTFLKKLASVLFYQNDLALLRVSISFAFFL